MSRHVTRHALLNGAGRGSLVALGLAISSAAGAQTAPVAQPAAEVKDEVVVTGYRGSLARSLDLKRGSSSLVDAISTEDIGSFPAINAAEALQLVPGVSIGRFRGEGLTVNVRGLGPTFQDVLLNGRPVAIGENVENSSQAGRQFRYDVLPTESISRITVHKSPTADLDEGALGGTINVETFHPLDLGKNRLAASAQSTYSTLTDHFTPRVSAFGNWVNADKTFGVSLSGLYTNRESRLDRAFNIGNKALASYNGLFAPDDVRYFLEDETKKEYSITGAVQWRPSENFEISLDGLYTHQNVNAKLQEAAFILPGNISGLTSFTSKDGFLTSATTSTASARLTTEDNNLRNDLFAIGLHAKWTSDAWTVSVDGAYSRALSTTDPQNPIRRVRLQTPSNFGITWNQALTNDKLHDIILNTPLTPATLFIPRLEWRIQRSDDVDYGFQGDVERKFEGSFIKSVMVGVKIHKRQRNFDRRDIVNAGSVAQTIPLNQLMDLQANGGLFPNFPAANRPATYIVPNVAAFHVGFPTQAQLAAPLSAGDLRNSYVVSEKIFAAYLRVNYAFDLGSVPIHGDVGVRYANTQQITSGVVTTGSVVSPVSFPKSYTDWLPNLNFVADLNENLLLRATASKVISRAALTDIAPRLSADSGGRPFASGGNPQLEPFRANQYDLSLEWYFAKGSFLSAGVFYKDITSFVGRAVQQGVLIGGVPFAVTAPVNSGSASIKGIETALQYQFKGLPAPFDGLGIQANYTYVDTTSQFPDGLNADGTLNFITRPIAAAPKHTVNLVAFYEKNGLGIRVNYNWKGEAADIIGTGGLPNFYSKPYGSMDANISYDVNKHFTIYADAVNITNNYDRRYTASGYYDTASYFGRYFTIGVRGKF